MVAIFAGLGAGFARGSSSILGSAGQLGGALLGRGGEGVSVNAATGNLVLSRQDEFLVGRGLDAGVSRTYNSLGQTWDRDNNDGWQQSTTQRILELTGTLNTAGSTVKRLGADGSVVTYAWGTRGNISAYWTTDGSGAHDRLERSGSNWVWTDGDSQITETYGVSFGSAAEWRLIERRDLEQSPNPNVVTFSYLNNSDLLDKVTTANGDWLKYVWLGTTVTQIITGYTDLATSTAKTLSRTWYDYTGGRLSQVRVDLTPEDNTSPTAAQSYWTQYSYDGAGRVTRVLQKDGSQVDIVYDGSGRVSTVTQQVATGDWRVTSLVYGSGFTSVTGPDGQATRLDYDAAGQLIKITAPPAFVGATAQVVQFAYDAEGNLASVTDAGGRVTSYLYDSFGNVTKITDPNLNTVERWYDSGNRVVLERTYGSHATGASVDQYTRYAYDGEGHLRYMIDREGRVTEYRYTTPGQLQYTIEYPQHQYTGQWSDTTNFHLNEGYANAWRDALTDRSSIKQTSYTYDARGNQTELRNFGAATAAGATATTEGWSRVYTSYDQAGRLLSRYAEGETAESFIYDGLGRPTASTDVHGGTTTFVFNDAALTTTVTSAAGYTSVQTFNKAGELVSSVGNGNYDMTGTSQLRYDKNGRVRMTVDETGYKSFMVYDRAGQLAGSVNHLGDLTEYRRDRAGRVIAEVRYAGTVSAANLTTLENPDNALQLSDLRPAANAADIWSWTVYDAAGRVVQTIDGMGGVAAFEYDQSGRLVRTTSYFTQVAVAGLKTTPPTVPVAVTAHANDTVTRSFYNRSGQMIGMLDGEGYLSEIVYDQAGQKIEEVAYATRTSSTLWASGTFAQLRASADPANANNRRVRYVYDGQGLLRYQVDGTGAVTGFAYNAAGKLTASIAVYTPISTTDYSYQNIKSLVPATSTPQSSGGTRVGTQLVHQMMAATMRTAERKMSARLS
jgi:YD repeat-containing protein